jgi:serine/threonine protein kinase
MSRSVPEEAVCAVCGAQLREARCAACGAAARPGGYVVRRLIARTPHSRVYLAQAPSGQEVALKELLFAQVPGPRELDSFEREARMLEALSHPRIPRLLGHFQEGEGAALRLYVAAEYIAGETLLERLGHHTFGEEEAQDVALQVLDILEYLHERKPRVLHRDLKPANLIRRPDGTLALVDFGAAREFARGGTAGSSLVGTFGYMPLEQLGGTVDATSDLYALGATLVHLLGRTPPADHFQPERGLDLSHLEAPALKPWLRKLTAPRPEDRYPSAAAARQALETLRAGGQPVSPTEVLTLSPNAPASLARLAREAQEAREASSRAQGRVEQQALATAQGEARKQAELRARHDDDRLSLLDFYRMASPRVSGPAALPWVGLLIGGTIYTALAAFELMAVPALDTVAGLKLVGGLILAAYVALGMPPLLKALWWRQLYSTLPFELMGLGRLVHRGEGEWRKLTRCTLRLVLKPPATSILPADIIKAAQITALRVFVDRANGALSRIAGHPEFFEKLRWTLVGDRAEGYANRRMAGQLLVFCAESLAPLKGELGLQSVFLEPSDEHFTLPDPE